MHARRGIGTMVVAVIGTVGLWMLSHPALSEGQSLIHACVNSNNGALRIVAPGTTCGPRETLLTWPSAPTAPTTFYQRVSATLPVAQGFVTAVALCDDPEDTATGGGHRFDGVDLSDPTTAVVTSTSCVASGLCGGATGEDGWVVVAKSDRVSAAGIRITAYVICAQL